MKKLLYSVIVAVFVFSCNTSEEVSSPTKDIDSEVINYIKSLGFDDGDIIEVGNNYIVEGDIVFPKNMIIPKSKNDPGARVEQYYGGPLISAGSASNIRIMIDASMTSMVAEINGAIAHWNSLPNTSIYFSIVTSGSYNILIKDTNLGAGTCGQAPLPSNGSAGSVVEINKTYISANSFAQRQRTIIHELGHAIGFLHTNLTGNGGYNPIDVPGVGGTDASSLMNGGQCGMGAVTLSAKDRLATSVLYPIGQEELYITNNGSLYAVDNATGIGLNFDADFQQTDAMTSLGQYIYTVQAGTLYRINSNNGAITTFSHYPTGWSGTEAMTALGSYIYAVQGGTLYRVNVNDGAVTEFSNYPTGWSGTEAMAAVGSNIYAVQGGTLYRVNVNSGAVTEFSNYPTGWSGTEAMAAIGSNIYAVQGGTLYRVNVNNGAVEAYSDYPSGWEGTEALTAKNNYLYGVQGGALWRVNLSTGNVSQLGNLSLNGKTTMAAIL